MVEQPNLNGFTVLILEDDFFQADNARRTLEQAGARVLGPFSDETSSMQALQAEQLDCALLDINLGSGPSFKVAHTAKALGIPIIFMTGYNEGAIALEFSGIERLQKPVPAARLVAAVSNICYQRQDHPRALK